MVDNEGYLEDQNNKLEAVRKLLHETNLEIEEAQKEVWSALQKVEAYRKILPQSTVKNTTPVMQDSMTENRDEMEMDMSTMSEENLSNMIDETGNL